MNRAIRFKFGIEIEDGPLRHVDHKITPKWAWPGHVTQFRNFGTPLKLLNNMTYLLQIWYRDGGRILPAYEPQNDP